MQYFKDKGPKIIIILDNASYHKKQAVIDKIVQNMPNIMLEFLPAYGPDYNIIELVWHVYPCQAKDSAELFHSNRFYSDKHVAQMTLSRNPIYWQPNPKES